MPQEVKRRYFELIRSGLSASEAAVLIGAQVCHRRGIVFQQRIGLRRERIVHHRPGDPGVPGRLRRGDPAVRDLVRGLLAQPDGDPAPRRQRRHPPGLRGHSLFWHLRRSLTQRRSTASPARSSPRGDVRTRWRSPPGRGSTERSGT
jgi:hypothetical protein